MLNLNRRISLQTRLLIIQICETSDVTLWEQLQTVFDLQKVSSIYHWLILLKTIISCEGPHIFCIRSLRFTMTKQREMVTLSISFTVLSKIISLIQLQVTSFILSANFGEFAVTCCSRIYSDIHSYNLLYKYIPIFVLINLRWHISYMVALEYIQILIRIIFYTKYSDNCSYQFLVTHIMYGCSGRAAEKNFQLTDHQLLIARPSRHSEKAEKLNS